jgi:hypothetical protein
MESKKATLDGSPARVTKTLGMLYEDWIPALIDGPGFNRPVIDITFQSGPIPDVGYNGCTVEQVIDALVERLEGFQQGPLVSAENFQAIVSLKVAKFWLMERTKKRREQGVEGTTRAHVS